MPQRCYSFEIDCRADESNESCAGANNLSLCWISTLSIDNNIPYNNGYYFNDYPQKTGRVYFSKTLLGEAIQVADFSDCKVADNVVIADNVLAVSPKHGSIITGLFDVEPGKGLVVYEDCHYGLLNIDDAPIQAWLYNVGIGFFIDSKGEEYCLFGEFSHGSASHRRMFKGKYPYSDRGNWKIVHEFADRSGKGITPSYYQIKQDPWSKYIYCTTGPNTEDASIFYSQDDGESWNYLVGNLPAGCLKMINFIFLEDYIWWASDESPHLLFRVQRDNNGVINPKTIEIVAHLPILQATNAMAYIDYLNCFFFYDRVFDNNKIKLQACIYDIDYNKLHHVADFMHIKKCSCPWGFRGKCYNIYPNLSEKHLAMGIIDNCSLCKLGNPFENLGDELIPKGTLMLSINKTECYYLLDNLKSRIARIKKTIANREFDLFSPKRCNTDKMKYEYGFISGLMLLIINLLRKTYKVFKKNDTN